jgi:hypothetical protein
MTDFDDPHAPRPEFRDSLEREIARELRREDLFEPLDTPRRSRRFAMVLGIAAGGVITLTIGLVLGASTGYASAEVLRAHANHDTTTPAQPALTILRTLPVRDAINAVTCAASLSQPSASPVSQGIPVVALPDASAKSSQTFGAILGIRQTADGTVLVDDAGRRQLKLLDASLANATIAMDSIAGSARSYGRRPVPLIPYLGDSTLLPDLASRTVSVLDAHGQVARSLALPTTMDIGLLARGGAVDDRGRLIYVGSPVMRPLSPGMPPATSDSVPVLRADFGLRRTDTLGRIAQPLGKTVAVSGDGSTTLSVWTIDPLRTIDNWAVLSDGSVALVRGHDYHIDWIPAAGPMWSTTKLPFDWKRLSDDDKQRINDSTRARLNAEIANGSIMDRAEQVQVEKHAGGGGGGGAPVGGGRGERTDAGGARLGGRAFEGFTVRPTDVIPVEQMPDFYPPLRPGSTIADADGNLWILPTTSKYSKQGELVYDVVNAKGELFERVRVPLGRVIVGFAKGGVVYMTSGDRATGYTLERSTLPTAGTSK